MPDPEIFGGNRYGKGIYVLNLYGAEDIAVLIENNLILNADIGVYLYSQRLAGTVGGCIQKSTFDNNGYAIVERMPGVNPLIQDNIITNSTYDAIHLTHEGGTLLDERLPNIINNGFWGNTHNVWCDELQAEQFTLPDAAGNINEDPEYYDPENLDYYPQNINCEDKGYRLE